VHLGKQLLRQAVKQAQSEVTTGAGGDQLAIFA
jgi:hypothetical protein